MHRFTFGRAKSDYEDLNESVYACKFSIRADFVPRIDFNLKLKFVVFASKHDFYI